MSAAAPNPSNMIMLGVLGVGAYWYFTRRAMAARPRATPMPGNGPAQWAAHDASLWGAVAKIIDAVTPAQQTSYQRANAAASGGSSGTSSPTGDPYNDGAGYEIVGNPSPSVDYDSWLQNEGGGDLGAFF